MGYLNTTRFFILITYFELNCHNLINKKTISVYLVWALNLKMKWNAFRLNSEELNAFQTHDYIRICLQLASWLMPSVGFAYQTLRRDKRKLKVY